ncbi:MAG: YqjK family protein [Candidatus Binatia bacterium]
MSSKLAELARRRESLISRAAAQRDQLAQSYQPLQRSIRFVSRVVGLMQFFKAHPALVMGVTALIVSARWGKLGKLPQRLWMGWQILQPLQAWWSRKRL